MADEVDIECPGCGAVFGIPVELCGEMAQCAECEVIFEIPTLDEDEGDGVSTDTGAIKGIEADGDATNTVRLSRTGIGMIPQIKDGFMTDYPVTSAPAPSKSAPTRLSAPKPSASKPSAPPPPPPTATSAPLVSSAPKAPATTDPAPSTRKPKKKVSLPSWINLRMMRNEVVEDVKEGAHASAGMAILVLFFVAAAGGAGIFLANNVTVAGAAVGGLAIVAFVIFLLVGKEKRALIVTSKRTVCFIGSERLEIKK